MPRFLKYQKKSKGQLPGALIAAHSSSQAAVKIRVFNFDANSADELNVEKLQESVNDAMNKDRVTWVHISGLSDLQLIKDIGTSFGIHSLWLEDVLNTDHRPKLEELEDLVFCIFKDAKYQTRASRLIMEQVSLFLGDHFVVSIQEQDNDLFEPICQRIRNNKGRVRHSGADYLFYALIDTIIDNYFETTAALGKEIERLEDRIFEDFSSEIAIDINRLKSDILFLKKNSQPIRDLLQKCLSSDRKEFRESSHKYFKDAYDQALQVVEALSNYREILDSARDLHQSQLANKANETMKVLTIFAAIFIPLTFIVGIYGMNFDHIPELKWKYGYYYVWALMITSSIGMLIYFRIKKWL